MEALIKSTDIPQANRLSYIRAVVGQLREGVSSPSEIHKNTGVPVREVSYAIHAARILNFISDERKVRRLGVALIESENGSSNEIEIFASAIKSSIIIQIVPELLSKEEISQSEIAREIRSKTSLSEETSKRRAGTLIAWRRGILGKTASTTTANDCSILESVSYERMSEQISGPARAAGVDRASPSSQLHILRKLALPWRYEILKQRIGLKITEVLVEPSQKTKEDLLSCIFSIRHSGEGMFVPIVGAPGTGKTTLANSLSSLYADSCTNTLSITNDKPISFDELSEQVRAFLNELPPNHDRIVPLNIDHRESNPPNDLELAAIKRFLRTHGYGTRVLILWPETSEQLANRIAADYKRIAGASVIEIPLKVEGPEKETWQEIVTHTLELCNDVPNLEELGINPKNYNPLEFTTIGEFIKKIGHDFIKLQQQLLAETKKPINLVLLFASLSADPGCLTKVTSPAKPGLLDANGLLKATGNSVIGRWWKERRGLLTQTIYKLNARSFCLAPSTVITLLRANSTKSIQSVLKKAKINARSASDVIQYMSRTDLGKYLVRGDEFPLEDRGRPADPSVSQAFKNLAAGKWLINGNDKKLNRAISKSLKTFISYNDLNYEQIFCEKGLGFCRLIPDCAMVKSDEVVCLEFAWRNGEFLSSARKSEVAQYILTKLKNYARELGWTSG